MVELEIANRRKEVRMPASGAVILDIEDPIPTRVRGQLMDRSASGFRATHQFPELRTGAVVRYQIGSRKGRAQVMWNRHHEGIVETGFLIVG